MKLNKLLIAGALSLWLSPPAIAEAVAPGMVAPESTANKPATVTESAPQPEDGGPPSLFDDGKTTVKTANLTVRIRVFRNVQPQDSFSLHPYPVRPPKVDKRSVPLPTELKYVKAQLLSSGYQNVTNEEKPYPNGGWRWHFAMHEGIRKSGMNPPHSIFTEYQWAADIAPYVAREAKRWNETETQRWRRYDKACAEFEKTRVDAENAAIRQGFSPIQMRKVTLGLARTEVPAGSWWLTCTRKCPGLTYFWEIPLSLSEGENVKVLLTEANALVITGAW